MKKNLITKTKNVWRDSYYHKLFGLKVAKEAQRVLYIFESESPTDTRPRLAIEAIKSWAENKRTLSMKEVRKLALGAHDAARKTKTLAGKFAARAAANAVATWYVPTHALAVPMYVQKSLCAVKNCLPTKKSCFFKESKKFSKKIRKFNVC
jgi:hypothetical protein